MPFQMDDWRTREAFEATAKDLAELQENQIQLVQTMKDFVKMHETVTMAIDGRMKILEAVVINLVKEKEQPNEPEPDVEEI